MKNTWMTCAAGLALAIAATGCGGKDESQGHGPPPGFAVNVKAAQAVRQPVEEKLSLVATILANESVELRSEMDGIIQEIRFTEGQPVEAGAVLVKLDQAKLAASTAQAEANYKLAESNRERAEQMFANKTISQQEFDSASASFEANKATLELMRQQLKDSTIKAPFGGIMGSREVSPGDVVGRTTKLSSLVDIDPVKVEFRVPERFLGQLKEGQSIQFGVPAYPGEVFKGEVYFIDPQVETATRTVQVKAMHANVDHRLRPGMFGNLELILSIKAEAVVIPETAIMSSGDRTSVFLVDAENKAELRPVTVGVRMAGQVEIAEGLQGGENVVTEGIQKLNPGMPVHITNAKADEPQPESGS